MSLFRLTSRIRSTQVLRPYTVSVPRRFAGDYGSVQGGQEQGINEDNPKKHLEHPGPEAPATKAGGVGPAPNSGPKDGAEPKIHQPKSAAEDENEDVRKHNEEMRNRPEKSANQLGEEDNKVNKKFWTGDVGDVDKKQG